MGSLKLLKAEILQGYYGGAGTAKFDHRLFFKDTSLLVKSLYVPDEMNSKTWNLTV